MEADVGDHKDRLGRILKVGDCVAVSHHNQLMIAVIKKLNPKMIKVIELGSRYRSSYNKYSSECVRLDGPDISLYLLTHKPQI